MKKIRRNEWIYFCMKLLEEIEMHFDIEINFKKFYNLFEDMPI